MVQIKVPTAPNHEERTTGSSHFGYRAREIRKQNNVRIYIAIYASLRGFRRFSEHVVDEWGTVPIAIDIRNVAQAELGRDVRNSLIVSEQSNLFRREDLRPTLDCIPLDEIGVTLKRFGDSEDRNVFY